MHVARDLPGADVRDLVALHKQVVGDGALGIRECAAAAHEVLQQHGEPPVPKRMMPLSHR